MKGPPELGPIVGESMAIRRARELIERYAPTSVPILLVGGDWDRQRVRPVSVLWKGRGSYA